MEKKIVIKIGIYVTIAIMILIWGLSYLKGERLFKSNNEYVAVYSRLEGLAESCPIMLSGYRIGTVKSVDFVDDGTQLSIITHLNINSDFKLPKGTVAKIISIDIMGSKGIEIVRPQKYDSYYNEGDTIPTTFDGGIMEMAMDLLMPMRDHLGNILASADSAMQTINSLMTDENIGNLTQSLDDLNKLSRSLAANTGNISNMISNFNNLSNAVGKNSDNINRAIGNFAALSDTLGSMNIGQTLADAQTALNNVNSMLNAINNGSGTAHQIISNDTLYNNLQLATEKINYLLDDFEKHPKKYVNLAIFGGKEKKKKE